MRKFTEEEIEAQAAIIASATRKRSDGYALHLRLEMESGNFAKALPAIESALESESVSPDMRKLAAHAMRQLRTQQKRVRSAAPKDWMKIGRAVHDLRKAGRSHQEAVEEYAEQEGIGTTKIDQAAGFYFSARRILV